MRRKYYSIVPKQGFRTLGAFEKRDHKRSAKSHPKLLQKQLMSNQGCVFLDLGVGGFVGGLIWDECFDRRTIVSKSNTNQEQGSSWCCEPWPSRGREVTPLPQDSLAAEGRAYTSIEAEKFDMNLKFSSDC